jgi:activating signal cointegrator complex subunit 3
MIDVAAESGWLATTLQIQTLLQMIVQGCWHNQSSLLTLPHLERFMLYVFKTPKQSFDCLPTLIDACAGDC